MKNKLAQTLISLEGLPGAGKTTQCRLLMQRLNDTGYQVAYLPDLAQASTNDLGTRLFDFFASTGDQFMRHNDVFTDSFLAAAIRVNSVAQTVLPALKMNDVVLEDRSCHTMYSYSLATFMQYYHSDNQKALIWLKSLNALGNIDPDITILLDTSVEDAFRRFAERDGKELTEEQKIYLKYVHLAYSEIAASDEKILKIDTRNKTAPEINDMVYELVINQVRTKLTEIETC